MSVYDPNCYCAVMQDGGASRQGTILADSEKSSNRQLLWYSNNIGLCNISGVGWLNVKWDNGQENSYGMGAQGCYDLQLLTGNFMMCNQR